MGREAGNRGVGDMQPMGTRGWGTPWVIITLTAALALMGGIVSYLGIQDRAPSPAVGPPAAEKPSAGPVHAIVLPYEEPALPPGPNRELVQTSCTVCHS